MKTFINAKGTRDFLPLEARKRQYIFEILKTNFGLHGFQPIETPAFENYDTLMGKYGEEGDKLIFKILNNGDFLSGIDLKEEFSAQDLSKKLCDRALRYDLTIPFARFVVQHQNELSFPFRRYQIQPVWRADRPQKGRYREFYQCDVDMIGSGSILQEVELLEMIELIFQQLGLSAYQLEINHRKLLEGLTQHYGFHHHFNQVCIVIDKWDKIGGDKVYSELEALGLGDNLKPFFNFLNTEKIPLHTSMDFLDKMPDNPLIQQAVNELKLIAQFNKSANRVLNIKLARGIDYYTGTIIEATQQNFSGSIGGGGRYDDLTSVFGKENLSGLGFSFGADRIQDLMNQLGVFPENLESSVEVLLIHFGVKMVQKQMEVMDFLRKNNIPCYVYPEEAKLKKQLKYANDIKARFVLMLGEQELSDGQVVLKNMLSGDQFTFSIGKMDDLRDKICST